MGPRWRVGFPPQPFLFRPRAGGGDGTGAGRPQVRWRLAAAGHDGRRPGGGLGRRSRLRGAAFPGGQATVRALLWDLLLPPRAGQQGAADHLPVRRAPEVRAGSAGGARLLGGDPPRGPSRSDAALSPQGLVGHPEVPERGSAAGLPLPLVHLGRPLRNRRAGTASRECLC